MAITGSIGITRPIRKVTRISPNNVIGTLASVPASVRQRIRPDPERPAGPAGAPNPAVAPDVPGASNPRRQAAAHALTTSAHALAMSA